MHRPPAKHWSASVESLGTNDGGSFVAVQFSPPSEVMNDTLDVGDELYMATHVEDVAHDSNTGEKFTPGILWEVQL